MRTETIEKIKDRLEEYADYEDPEDLSEVADKLYDLVEADVRAGLKVDLTDLTIAMPWPKRTWGEEMTEKIATRKARRRCRCGDFFLVLKGEVPQRFCPKCREANLRANSRKEGE